MPAARRVDERLALAGLGPKDVDTPVGYNKAMKTGVEVCVECAEDLEHCHGVAIVQIDESYECSDDPECRLTIEQHRWVAAAES
ncbi:MAG TPA: hypothetical protein VIJ34_13495 [Acidimicrobiales bacterium]